MSSPGVTTYADLIPPGALASEPSDSEQDSNADFSYESDVSDGDPPHLSPALALARTQPPPRQSQSIRQPIPPPAVQPVLPPPVKPTSIVLIHKEGGAPDGGVKPIKVSRRKALAALEKDAWFTPDEFYAELAELAA